MRLEPREDVAVALMMDAMGERGFESFLETDDGFEGYIQELEWEKWEGTEGECVENEHNGKEKRRMGERIMDGVEPGIEGVEMTWESEDAPDEDWNAEWEKSGYTPIEINGGRCVIHGPSEGRMASELDVVIDPRNAFGSGHHETTRMIVRELMGMDVKGKVVMDMGCGTGVLGIVAVLRGAARADGVDIDEWSVENMRHNAELNGIGENVRAWQGTAESLVGHEGEYDVLIANIFREIIVGGMEMYAMALKRGGVMILSGFMAADLEIIKECGAKHGMEFVRYEGDGEWRMCVMRKKGDSPTRL